MATTSVPSTGGVLSTTARGPSPSPSSASRGNHGGAVAGAVIGALLALVLLVGVYYWRRSRRSQHAQLPAASSAVRVEKPRQAYLNPSFDESLLPPDEVDVAQDEGTDLEDRPPGRSRDAWDDGIPLQPIPKYYDTPALASDSRRGISSSGSSGGARQIDEDDALVSETSA